VEQPFFFFFFFCCCMHFIEDCTKLVSASSSFLLISTFDSYMQKIISGEDVCVLCDC
jgi:hypothetical protein